ncbi:MAG: hypothetical protein HW401_306, partial [Parcubacteria group bacterium]|nr:hypothetical protein [Parcubacteria group bacterium]
MKNSRNKILASAIKPKSANKKGDLKLVKKAVKDLSKVVPFSMSRQVDSLKRVCLEKISIFSDELSNNPKKLDSFNPYPSQGIIPPEKEDNKTAERRNSVRKNLFSYGVYGINLSSRLFKLIAVFLIVGVNLHGLSAVGITVAHFADSEKSSGNLIDSAILDFSLSTAGWAPSDPLYPGSSTTENIIVADEDDSVDFKYIASIVETGGDHNFCEEIGLEASLDGAPVYSGDLLSFVSSNINFGSTTDEWSFKVKLPSDASDVDGKKCEFDFLYQSWQNEFPVYPNGFHDEEKVQNKIESAKKTCNSDDDNDNHGRDDDDDEHHGSDGHHNGGDYDDSDSNEHHNEHDNFNNQHYSDDRGHDDDDEDDDDNCSSPKEDEKLIVINEFLPNPIGNDNKHMPKGEWVELYNLGDNPINVADWVLYDNNDSHPLKIKLSNSDNDGNLGDGGETIVPPHGFLVVYLNGKY